MKYTLLPFLLLLSIHLFGQDDKIKNAIIEEGKALYQSEMASWYGTDIFREKMPEQMPNAGGYFSYSEKEVSKCIFYDKQETPQIIAEISFDETYKIENAQLDSVRRIFTKKENDLYLIRKAALELTI